MSNPGDPRNPTPIDYQSPRRRKEIDQRRAEGDSVCALLGFSYVVAVVIGAFILAKILDNVAWIALAITFVPATTFMFFERTRRYGFGMLVGIALALPVLPFAILFVVCGHP